LMAAACSSDTESGSSAGGSPATSSTSTVGSGGTGGTGGQTATSSGGAATGGAGGTGGTGTGGALNCVTCSEIEAGGITKPICGGNGPPSTKEIFAALVACICEEMNCYTECQASCDQFAFPDETCHGCYEVACAAELQTCLDDKP
jgi:hypothetical protein